ncbi:MAG: FecR domain-containing protein [Sphingobium sp.]
MNHHARSGTRYPRNTRAFMAAGLLGLTILTAAAPAAFTPAAAQTGQKAPLPARLQGEEDIRYVVRKGDTLYSLAQDHMWRPTDWRPVQRLNRVRDPLRLLPGTTLIIPARLLRTLPLTAHIAAFKGAGSIGNGAKGEIPLALNQAITPGMTIETGKGGFVTLQLSNGSRLTLPSQTRIRVATLRRFQLNGMVDVTFLLEKGRVETNATPVGDSGGRYRIRTPIAVSAVRGTVFRAEYDAAAALSRTEVVEGNVAVSDEDQAAAQNIGKGFGAIVSTQGDIRREELLPAPELLNPGKVQVDPQVAFTLKPLDKAQRYHVQIARDPGFIEMEQELYSTEPDTRFDDIGNGRWFVRASAVAASGLEGMPQTYAMRRMRIDLAGSSGQEDDGAYRFRWNGEDDGAMVFHFRLRPDAPGSIPLVDEPGLSGTALSLTDIPPGKYRWTVGARRHEDGESATNWLPEQSLIVADEEGTPRSGSGAKDR